MPLLGIWSNNVSNHSGSDITQPLLHFSSPVVRTSGSPQLRSLKLLRGCEGEKTWTLLKIREPKSQE